MSRSRTVSRNTDVHAMSAAHCNTLKNNATRSSVSLIGITSLNPGPIKADALTEGHTSL